MGNTLVLSGPNNASSREALPRPYTARLSSALWSFFGVEKKVVNSAAKLRSGGEENAILVVVGGVVRSIS